MRRRSRYSLGGRLLVVSLLTCGFIDAQERASSVAPKPLTMADTDSLLRRLRESTQGYSRRELAERLYTSFSLSESLKAMARERMVVHLEQAKRDVYRQRIEFLAKRVTDVRQIDTISELSGEGRALLLKRYQENHSKVRKK